MAVLGTASFISNPSRVPSFPSSADISFLRVPGVYALFGEQREEVIFSPQKTTIRQVAEAGPPIPSSHSYTHSYRKEFKGRLGTAGVSPSLQGLWTPQRAWNEQESGYSYDQ